MDHQKITGDIFYDALKMIFYECITRQTKHMRRIFLKRSYILRI